jgi:transcriptional regulator with XRE-family HTH domain
MSLGLGLRSFAALVQVSPSHLSRIERGIRGAQPEVLARIATELRVPIKLISEEAEVK